MTFDAYPTPPWCTRRILEAVGPRIVDWSCTESRPRKGPLQWLEPFAGDGAMVREIRASSPGAHVEAWELQREKGAVLRAAGANLVIDGRNSLGDHLLRWPARDIIISNPPFIHAQEAVLRAMCAAPWVIMLLRIGWLQGGRDNLFRANMPDEYRLPERPHFIASLKCDKCTWALKQVVEDPRPKACPDCGADVKVTTSDSSEYGWFVWTPERGPVGHTHMLPRTPESERKTVRRSADTLQA